GRAVAAGSFPGRRGGRSRATRRSSRLLRRRRGVEARDLLADAGEKAMADLVVGARERGGEGEAVGRSVALHDDAPEPEERGAVVAAMVHAAAEAPDHGIRDER